MEATVVVVDGNIQAARILASHVNRTPGFAVIGIAHAFDAAMALLAERPPDILLLDVHLLDGNGLEILRSVSARTAEPAVLMTTAARDRTTVDAALRHGAVGYLTKPFGYAAVRRCLETCQHRTRVASPDTLILVKAAAFAAGIPVSAAEVAVSAGVSRATAHRYLTRLVDSGALRVHLRYGTTGRPKNYYQPTERG